MAARNTILRLPVVIKRTGLPRSTIYAHMAEGRFPKQIKLGKNTCGWIEAEIDEWIEACIEASR